MVTTVPSFSLHAPPIYDDDLFANLWRCPEQSIASIFISLYKFRRRSAAYTGAAAATAVATSHPCALE